MMHFRVIDRTEAQADPLGAVMITGDYGGFTYLICKASRVNATDRVLDQLALDLDAVFCDRHNPAETAVRWVITNPWEEWGGTSPIEDGLWIRTRLVDRGVSCARIIAILAGEVDEL